MVSSVTVPPEIKKGHFSFGQRGHYSFGLTVRIFSIYLTNPSRLLLGGLLFFFKKKSVMNLMARYENSKIIILMVLIVICCVLVVNSIWRYYKHDIIGMGIQIITTMYCAFERDNDICHNYEEIDNTFGLPPADINDWLAYRHANQDVIDTRYTKSDVVKMMRQERFEELEHYFLAVQSDYENKKFNEHTYEVLMNSLKHDSGEAAVLYGGWLKIIPDSYIAHAGRGATNSSIGWDKRGSKWSKETPKANFKAMHKYHLLAANDLRIAVTIYPKFTWGYVDLVHMGNFGPTAMSRKHWLAKSLKYDPYNYIVRKATILKLKPRWGGSHREMHELALSALSYIDKNPILRGLPVYEYADKANIFARQKRYAEAIEAGSMAIYHRPAETAYYSRAYAHQEAKNYAAAVADAEQGLKQRPDHIKLLHVYAWSARDDHQYEKADDGYERLIRLRPNMATYWYSRGALQYRLNNFNTAMPYLNKSNELEPSNNKYLYWSALASVINEMPIGLVKTREYLERCENSKCKEANLSWARRWIACVDGKPECDLPEHDYINWRE